MQHNAAATSVRGDGGGWRTSVVLLVAFVAATPTARQAEKEHVVVADDVPPTT
jgi:hypothetical protein